jgi:hypothetical protein
MEGSLGICDLSQSIDRAALKTDGLIPTQCTTSRTWAFQLGGLLSVPQLRYLAGLPQSADFGNQSEASARRLLGNKMHCSDVGVVAGINIMMALVCLPAPPPTV